MNRRKQEYLDLVKKPCFTQTIIRIKMPDNWIFECVCTPLETLQTLLDIFNEVHLPLASASRTNNWTTTST
jgi:hypothetical protein